ncbi:phosphoserine phosphatase isoform X1 [Anopheles gambiae]|uniref:phosphoserine phosphatase isoform X1 n=1 Tax=Anopheles coluzzii TaxID=1518534 RepID=UPI0020FF909D|nr:phosphoserine phosphatase isoform X1 [Anopheles coluzzii]XP_061515881.1 phosphoserine phosphatase isoform X1 [Anopheles gambiae]
MLPGLSRGCLYRHHHHQRLATGVSALFGSLVAISATDSSRGVSSLAGAGEPLEPVVVGRRNSLPPASPIFKPIVPSKLNGLGARHGLHHQAPTNGNGMTNDRPVELSKRTTEAKESLKKAQIVCFDVDSTIITEEGIDELAQFCGKGSEVAALTKEAMGGSMTFQEALKRRLDIIKPSQRQIREFLKTHPSIISAGVKELIEQLRKNNAEIFLISGGFDCLIEPVADALEIPLCNLYANRLFFNYNGSYAGFDTTQPTSRSGGKGEAIKQIRSVMAGGVGTGADKVVAMIGDGMTDLEACPPANMFIGYGGNAVREEVQKRATYYVTNFADLLW